MQHLPLALVEKTAAENRQFGDEELARVDKRGCKKLGRHHETHRSSVAVKCHFVAVKLPGVLKLAQNLPLLRLRLELSFLTTERVILF